MSVSPGPAWGLGGAARGTGVGLAGAGRAEPAARRGTAAFRVPACPPLARVGRAFALPAAFAFVVTRRRVGFRAVPFVAAFRTAPFFFRTGAPLRDAGRVAAVFRLFAVLVPRALTGFFPPFFVPTRFLAAIRTLLR